ncbi:MAG: hypothetical protein LBO67_07785 [Spirochaetaceae bacterium]|jgi:flagellar basal body rod protein FlgG|nr:hypothetical protein [Spirochaetaceae bacterium]
MGPGFFKLVLDDGKTVGYTRNGEFKALLDEETETLKLVTRQGYALADPLSYIGTALKKDKHGRETVVAALAGNRRADVRGQGATVGEGEALLIGLD